MKRRIIILSGSLLLTLHLFSQAPTAITTDSVQIPWEQQMASFFQNADLSSVTSHVLVDRGLPLCVIGEFDSGVTDTSNAAHFQFDDRNSLVILVRLT